MSKAANVIYRKPHADIKSVNPRLSAGSRGLEKVAGVPRCPAPLLLPGSVKGRVFYGYLEQGVVLGRLHLICGCQDIEQVVLVPGGLELLGMDAAFGSFLVLEQVEGNMA